MHASAPVILYDDSLEANRRRAWACFYAQRERTVQVAFWGAEIAEWLEQLAGEHDLDLHPDLVELIALVRAPLPGGGQEAITRYVNRLRHPGAAAELPEDPDG